MKGYNDQIVYLDNECKRTIDNTDPVDNIDSILDMDGLFRLKNFGFAVGDCLFNTLQVLLLFKYTVTEIRNGFVEYLGACLQK